MDFLWFLLLLRQQTAVVAQLVEHQLPKLRVVGSNPIYRSQQIAPDFFAKAP